MGNVPLEEWAQLPQVISNLTYKDLPGRIAAAERLGMTYEEGLS